MWTTGPAVAQIPAVAVLEVAGAVLAWTVDDPADAAPRITFTDVSAAEWLWRLVGTSGHAALLAALDGRTPEAQPIDLPVVHWHPSGVGALRRLAVGHWARRWWPASLRDGIAGLDPALLDAELAVLTAQTQEFLDDDTMDGDVAGLLRRHRSALRNLRQGGDPRVAAVVDAAAEVAYETGAWEAADLAAAPEAGSAHRADYALAAGAGSAHTSPLAVASGVQSLNWAGCPAGCLRRGRRDRRVARRGSRFTRCGDGSRRDDG